MSYSVEVDTTALPDELLPLMKKHSRILFDDDDEILTEYLRWSIAYLEQNWGWQMNAATVAWSPASTSSRLLCPVQPVSEFTVLSGGTDVSAEYRLEGSGPTSPVWLVKIDGTAFPVDAAVTLETGYPDAASLPPNAVGGIMRLAAKFYEYRESITDLSLEQMPGWLEHEFLTGLWIPRC